MSILTKGLLHGRPLINKRQDASLVHVICSLSPATLWHYPVLALLSLCTVAMAASGADAARMSSKTLGLSSFCSVILGMLVLGLMLIASWFQKGHCCSGLHHCIRQEQGERAVGKRLFPH